MRNSLATFYGFVKYKNLRKREKMLKEKKQEIKKVAFITLGCPCV